jgi:ligand-binding sensor domain-containing protein
VISLLEDRERNLWCGTGAGLVVIHPVNLEIISPPDNWKNCPVLSVLPTPDGALWIGTEGAGLYRLQNGRWTNFDPAQGVHNPFIWSLAADAAGRIGPARGAADCMPRRTTRLILLRAWKMFSPRCSHILARHDNGRFCVRIVLIMLPRLTKMRVFMPFARGSWDAAGASRRGVFI